MIKTLIFDFDGTIADTMEIGLKIVEDYGADYGLPPVDRSQIERYKSMTAREVLKEYKIPLRKVPMLLFHFKKKIREKMQDAPVFSGIPEAIETLSKYYKLGILTSNSVENVAIFLETHNLNQYFSIIDSEINIFGKHRALKRLFKKYQISKDEVIYVGDEVRDIQACKKISIPIISVTYGFNNKEFLEKFEPDFLIDQPREIISSLESYNYDSKIPSS